MALLELIALFAVARVLGEACERVHVPALIGEIAAGVALGPLLLNWITPTDSVKLVADLGVFFIVYAAGMEMTFRGVLPGALAAAFLLEATFQVLPLYLNLSKHVIALQTLGAPALLLVWLYVMANVIVLGAEVNWYRGQRASPQDSRDARDAWTRESPPRESPQA